MHYAMARSNVTSEGNRDPILFAAYRQSLATRRERYDASFPVCLQLGVQPGPAFDRQTVPRNGSQVKDDLH